MIVTAAQWLEVQSVRAGVALPFMAYPDRRLGSRVTFKLNTVTVTATVTDRLGLPQSA